MNHLIPCVAAVLILSAAPFAAQADDAPKATPVVAQSTSPSAASPATTPPSAAAKPASDAGHPSVQRMVCLNMSLQCFAIKPKADDAPAKAQTASIDLKAPDIRRVVPEVQLRDPFMDVQEIEEQQVQVEGTRPEVYVPGGIASLPWAVMHPTQAWRIFLPVPPGTAK